MKKLWFYVLVIAIIVSFLHAEYVLGLVLTVLGTTLFTAWIQIGHYRYLKIKHLFLSFDELIKDNKCIGKVALEQIDENSNNLSNQLHAMIEKRRLDLEKESDEEKKKLGLENCEKLSSKIPMILSFYDEQKKNFTNFLFHKELYSAQIINHIYEEYGNENWLYYYKPLQSTMAAIDETIKKSKAGTFFVRLEQVDEQQKFHLTKAIKDHCKLGLKETKDKVDTVLLGSTSIIIENVNESTANKIKEIMNCYGIAVVVDNKKVI